MKRIAGVLLLACLSFPGSLYAVDSEELAGYKEKLSYSMGIDMGNYLNGIKGELDYDVLLKGLTTGFNGEKSMLTPEEMQKIQQEFAMKMKAKQEAEMLAMQENNKKAGDAFLAANKKKDGVTVTESGLQYEVITAGTGATPSATDTVTVHYKGTTIDGKVFDDSGKRGEPAVFGVNQVIPGWTEVLLLMKEGAKYHIVLPPAIAYGDRGVPPMIEPSAVLAFDLELISIEKDDPEKDAKK